MLACVYQLKEAKLQENRIYLIPRGTIDSVTEYLVIDQNEKDSILIPSSIFLLKMNNLIMSNAPSKIPNGEIMETVRIQPSFALAPSMELCGVGLG